MLLRHDQRFFFKIAVFSDLGITWGIQFCMERIPSKHVCKAKFVGEYGFVWRFYHQNMYLKQNFVGEYCFVWRCGRIEFI